uniref:Uncharacterized protein n=2 Tax=Oryza sativa subsp. japonica TaxID=39947 RepID=Q2R7H5_ORYSJ|nr:hypothetical protein LOC_Os11g16570 [Oryza sativa Japonica Group]ABA92589.1 hypothetical protein LOC_Os11g16570 [Oryza sativa Japonica Group]
MTCEEVNSLSEHHGAEVILYDFDEVHVVEDSFAGDTEFPDTQVAVDVQAVAVTELELHGLMESKLQDAIVDVVGSEVDTVVAVRKEDVIMAERELHDVADIVAVESEVNIVLGTHDEAMAMIVAVAEMELNGVVVAVPESELNVVVVVCEVVMDIDVAHALLHHHGTKSRSVLGVVAAVVKLKCCRTRR